MIYLILLVALAGIVFGADWLVSGSVSIAKRYKVSEFVIGAAIVGVGTSMPELTVSFIGALQGNSDVAIGNVVGSNIFNILLILGGSALISPISFGGMTMVDLGVVLLCSVFILMSAYVFRKKELDRYEGAIFILTEAAYMWYLIANL